MADEPETPETPEAPPAPPDEPVAPPASRRAKPKPPAKEGPLLAEADVDRIADRLLDKFRDAGAFDSPLDVVAPPTQPTPPPPASAADVTPADAPAPEPPHRQSVAARILGTG